MSFIYIIKNTLNNKVYIGQTINIPEYRFKQHIEASTSKKNQAITQAIDKYGRDRFYIDVLEQGDFNKKELNALEIEYIKKYDSLSPNGYNLTTGGKSNGSISEETRKRMSEAQKGKTVSEETKEKLREANIGKKLDENTKKLLSDISLNLWKNPEFREKVLKNLPPVSEENKEMQRKRLKELWNDPEYRKRMTGWHHSEEAKKKIGKDSKKRKRFDEQNKRISEFYEKEMGRKNIQRE